jgi:hypothetical protein
MRAIRSDSRAAQAGKATQNLVRQGVAADFHNSGMDRNSHRGRPSYLTRSAATHKLVAAYSKNDRNILDRQQTPSWEASALSIGSRTSSRYPSLHAQIVPRNLEAWPNPEFVQ